MLRRDTMDRANPIASNALQPLLAGSDAHRGGKLDCPYATVSSDADSAIMLDACGIVRGCDPRAAAVFGASADALLGQHIKKLLPDVPLRSSTPAFNIAYASFCAAQPVWTWHTPGDPAGRATGVYVSFLGVDDDDNIIVQVRDSAPPWNADRKDANAEKRGGSGERSRFAAL